MGDSTQTGPKSWRGRRRQEAGRAEKKMGSGKGMGGKEVVVLQRRCRLVQGEG